MWHWLGECRFVDQLRFAIGSTYHCELIDVKGWKNEKEGEKEGQVGDEGESERPKLRS